jgi:PilZ domain
MVALADNERWPARVHNLSTGGVGLRVDRRIEVGRFVLVELLSASGLFGRLLLTRVVHLSEHAEGGFFLGGEFISELPERELRFLLA